MNSEIKGGTWRGLKTEEEQQKKKKEFFPDATLELAWRESGTGG